MRLEMKNWLGYSSAVVQFAPGVHLICGPNGAGKSSVLDAVRWCLTGFARGTVKAADSALLRGDPAKPMSVSVEFARAPDGWPSAITRGSKLSIVPTDLEKPYKGRLDYLDACLGTWEFLRRSDGERSAFLTALQRFALDPASFSAELKRACGFDPPPPGTYNGQPWGPWESVAVAMSQAEAVRRSYAAAAKGPAAGEKDRIESLRLDLRDTAVVNRPDQPTGVVAPAEIEQRVTAQVTKLARIRFLAQALDDLATILPGDEFAPARAVVAQFVVDRCEGPRASEEQVLKDLNVQLESGAKVWARYKEDLAKFEANVALRQRMSESLSRAESDFKRATDEAAKAEQRRKNWDAIAGALKPDGKVSACLSAMATRAIDADRLSWAAETLGVRVVVGNDGAIQVLGRGSNQPSRGEQLLAALALQDAACRLAECPIILCDELESLDPAALSRAMEFLNAASEDYEAILCCRTTGLPLPASWRPAGVQLWTAGRGVLTSVT